MTAICGGGTSSVRSWVPASVFLTGEALAALLTDGIGTTIWADLIVYAGSQTFTPTAFCGSDPPAVPTFTATDVLEILNPNPFAPTGGTTKLNTLLQIAAWYVFCQCDSGSAATPATPPAYPTGAPVLNPPIGTTASGACWQKTNSITIPGGTWPCGGDNIDQTSNWLPGTEVGGMTGNGPCSTFASPIPTGSTNLKYSGSSAFSGSSSISSNLFINFFNSSKALVAGSVGLFFDTQTVAQTSIPIPATAAYWNLISANNVVNSNWNVSMSIQFDCPGQVAGSPNTPCCPPDGTLLARLEEITGQLNAIYAALPSNPNSYANATLHSGLSGSGSVTLSSAPLALKITVTTMPTYIGRADNNPTTYFDVGWVAQYADLAPLRHTRLVHSPQFFDAHPLADTFGYDLAPGVVIDVQELVRGP